MLDNRREAGTISTLPRHQDQANDARGSLRTERALIVSLSLGALLIPFNTTMIAIVLRQLRTDLGVDAASAGWLITAYLITMACLQPIAGKLGDRWGRRPLILGGLAWFGIASAGAALAPNLAILLLFRVQQSIAGALAIPNGMALVREAIPAERRAGRFGQLAAAMALGGAIGPPASGLLLQPIGWRGLFACSVPLALLAVLLGWRSVPRGGGQRTSAPLDLLGLTLLPAVLAGAAWLLMGSRGLALPIVLAAVLALVVAGALFCRHEFRHPDPVLQPRLFRHRAFTAATSTIALTDLATFTTLLAMPELLGKWAGWDNTQIGLALMALSGTTIVFAPLGGRLADRVGRRWPAVAGLAALTVGEAILALTHTTISGAVVIGALGLIGAGWGIAAPGLQTAAIEAVEPDEVGVASGVMSAGRFLGSIAGASLFVSLLGAAQAGSGAFGPLFLCIVAAALLATVASLGLHDRPPVRA